MLLSVNILTMYTINRSSPALLLTVIATFVTLITGQTYSSCNPLQQSGCPADPALGTSKNIAFTGADPTDFTTSGTVTYDANGAAFTVAKSGDSPTLISKWYIMFGHVDFVVKAAPGQGIVSSAVLLSDCLDEIDFEWLGGDDTQVQSNYFGKGQTTTGYNRAAFHAAPGNHDGFNTYSIDWTADQIVWSVNGNAVRVLQASNAEAGQYPQTPMQIKVGSWAGGDPANAPGTVAWAGGPVDYSNGPYTMYVKAIAVTDYSTGSSYSYDGTAGTWQSIRSNGGTINSSGTGKNTPAVSVTPNYSTAAGNPTVPFSTDAAASSVYATRTGYPWTTPSVSAVTSVSPTVTYTSINGLPSGWTVGADGKTPPQYISSSSALPAGSSSSGLEVKTTFNGQGFPTTVTVGAISSSPSGQDASTSATPLPSSASEIANAATASGGKGQGQGDTTTTSTRLNNGGTTGSVVTAHSMAATTPAAVNEIDQLTLHKGCLLAGLALALAALML